MSIHSADPTAASSRAARFGDEPDLPIEGVVDEEPETDASMALLAGTDMEAFLGPFGPIAAALDDFESRPSQVAMAQAVQVALLERKHALVEAPTGTGKSLAYLIPAILSGRQVVIATANKSLQAQLYQKDIPFLAQALGIEIDAVVVKGRSNYLCLHKWENELQEQRQISMYDREHEQVKALRGWLKETATGDVDDLPFVIEPDLRPRLVSFPDDCIGRDCDFFDECFVERMRDRAAAAQVIITNHHLLLNALELGPAGERLLPPTGIYIIDEAHGLEQTATSVFETMVTDYTVEQLLSRSVLKEWVDEDVLDEVRFQNQLAFQEVKLLARENSFVMTGELEEIRKLGSSLGEMVKTLKKQNPYGEAVEGEERKVSQQRQMLARAVEALSGAATELAQVASARHDDVMVRYSQRVFDRRRVTVELHAAPIHPANLLSKLLFTPDGEETRRTVICTSATLSTAGSFAHFRARCGITTPAVEAVLAPVFDYSRQALLYQPALPAYDHRSSDGYYAAVATEIERLLQVSRGRALCLFTSWSGMQQVARLLEASSAKGVIWPLRSQGDAPREALLAWFRSTQHSVLLATRSFWEGVDIPGDDLSLVVLDKLPFPSPGDPLTSARMALVDNGGVPPGSAPKATGDGPPPRAGNSFGDYMVPLMTLALKQGFGRLIRRTSDRGVVAILDERLSSKSYGRQVVRDLPQARWSRDYRDVHRFFQSALATDAEFALNLWASIDDDKASFPDGVSGSWVWQLVRLLDGRSSEASAQYNYSAPAEEPDADSSGPYDLQLAAIVEGELVALAHALADLRGRVEKAGRSASDFSVEVRCHPESAAWLIAATGEDAQSTRPTSVPEPAALASVQGALSRWRSVHTVAVQRDLSAESAF